MTDIVEILRRPTGPIKVPDDLQRAADEIERLRAARDELRQTLWCVVHGVGVGGKVMLFRRDLEDFPGRDRAWLEATKDEMTGNLTLRAFEQSPPSKP